MNLQDFVKETFNPNNEYTQRSRIVCNDGFNMSVQGSIAHYCTPRINSEYYNQMEIGFPSDEEKELLHYAEDKDNPTDTVYGYVPVSLIQRVIDKHGGINVDATLTPS